MRILLRDHQRGLFYSGPGKWAKHSAEAEDFRDTSEALDQAKTMPERDLEIVMRFEDPVLDIPLSIVRSSEQQEAVGSDTGVIAGTAG